MYESGRSKPAFFFLCLTSLLAAQLKNLLVARKLVQSIVPARVTATAANGAGASGQEWTAPLK
jgi:hypothetical protein